MAALTEYIQDGVRYVPTKAIAKSVGLSPDYLSRFCREGAVAAVFHKGAWYVNEASLEKYLTEQRRAQEEYKRKLSEEAKKEVERSRPAPAAAPPAPLIRRKVQSPQLLLATLTAFAVITTGAFAFSAPEKFAQLINEPARASEQLAAAASSSWFDSLADNFYNTICPYFTDCEVQFATSQVPHAQQLPSQPRPTLATSSPTLTARPQAVQQTVIERVIERVVQSSTPLPLAELRILADRIAGLQRNQEVQIDGILRSLARTTGASGSSGGDSSTAASSITGTITNTINSLLGTISDLTSNTITATNVTFENATTTNATTTNLAVSGTATIGSGTGLLQTTSGVVSTLANGANGLVLKLVGGTPEWSSDLQGSGGGSSAWATTSDDLAIHPADTTDVLVIGSNATTTTGTILEVAGNSLFRGALTAYSTLTAPRFTATSSIASQLPYASTTALSATALCISTDCRTVWPSGADGNFSTTSADYWETQQSARTADDLTNNSIEDLNDVAAMTENYGDLFAWNGSAWADFATSTLAIALSDTTGTLGATRGGTGLSSVSAAGILLGNYAGTGWQQLATSTLGLLTTHVAEGSNLYYLDSRVQSFVHASTTIPKTYTANSFTGLQTFANASTTNISATYASSTQGFFGSLSIGSLSGFLKATAGAIATAAIDLANDVTGILGVGSGGTGWGSIASGALVLGNGTGPVATTTAGTDGQVLALSGGIPTWVATTTLSTISGTLAVGSGGTGLTSFTLGDVLYASGATSLAGTSTSNLKQTLALNNVENTALSTWAGSSNLTTLGTLSALTVSGNTSLSHATTSFLFVKDALSASSAAFGATATSTFSSTGALSLAGGLTLSGNPNGPLHANNGLVAATTSIGILYGGTGATSAAAARSNLLAAASGANADITSLSALTHSTTTFSFVNSALFNQASFGGTATSSFSTAGALTLASALSIASGGTGLTTAPTYGQLLVGNSSGGYTLTATSSLGITGGDGGSGGGQLLAVYSTSTPGTNVSVNFNGASGSAPSFSAGVLTLPSNTSHIVVEVWGGGGGGAGGAGSAAGAGGGASGSYSQKLYTGPSGTHYYNVGPGGAGGSAGANNGSAGSDSSFGTGSATTTASAGGGGGTSSGGIPGGGGIPGTASGGDVNIAGVYGGVGNPPNTTPGNGSPGGNGGSAPRGGSGGRGGFAGGGSAANVFGGGGGGAGPDTGNRGGGTGGTGGLVISVYTTGISNGSLASGTAGQFAFYNAAGTNLSATSSLFVDTATSRIGIGTSTPWGKLSINSTAGIPQFVIGSSTTQFIVDQNGNVGIGQSPATYALEIVAGANKGVYVGNNSQTPATPSNGAFFYAAGGEARVIDTGGNVTIISPHNFELIPGGPSEPMAWAFWSQRTQFDGVSTTTSTINVDMTRALRVLENLSGEKLVYIDKDGVIQSTTTPRNLLQDLNLKLEDLATTSATSSDAKAFSSRFFTSLFTLFTRLTQWFADATNGITDFFARRVRTQELCVDDVCVTRDQFAEVFGGSQNGAAAGAPSVEHEAPDGPSTNANSSADTATTTPTSEIVPITTEASTTPEVVDAANHNAPSGESEAPASDGASTPEPEPEPVADQEPDQPAEAPAPPEAANDNSPVEDLPTTGTDNG